MGKVIYIQTDANTTNLTELLLEKLESYERDNKVLMTKHVLLTNPTDLSQLFTEKEAAARLRISNKTLYNLRIENKIHYRQLETNIRYSLGDILEYEERCRR